MMRPNTGERLMARRARERQEVEDEHRGEQLTERTKERLVRARFYLDEGEEHAEDAHFHLKTQRSEATSRAILEDLESGVIASRNLPHNTRSSATPSWLHRDTHG